MDFLFLRSSGIFSQNVTRHQEFRDYVRGYDARASFPEPNTIRRLAKVVHELQREERMQRIARRKIQFKGGICIGLQLDMWTDSETNTAFACMSMTELEEPQPGTDEPQLWLSSEILAFSAFPYTSKTGPNIRKWIVSVLEDVDLPHDLTRPSSSSIRSSSRSSASPTWRPRR